MNMNCANYQNQLEDFLYGELEAAAREAISEHLSVCLDCRQAHLALERETEIFTQFYEANTLEPSDEMWTNIHTRIADEKPARASWTQKLPNLFGNLLTPSLLRQFAFAALLVIISVGATTLYFSMRGEEKAPVAENHPTPTPIVIPSATPTGTDIIKHQATEQNPAPPRPTEPKPQLAAVKISAPAKTEKNLVALTPKNDEQLLALQIGKATREYQSAIRLLERAVTKRKTDLDDGTIRQFEGSLALIDASIASSRQALRDHPNDPAAARYLLAAYSRKVELMQEIAMR